MKEQLSLSGKPVVVLYDGWCSFCIKSINFLRRIDCFNRIDFVSFRNENITEMYKLDIEMLEKRMHSIKISNNKIENGFNSIIRICRNIPFLWAIVPFLYFISFLRIGHHAYDWVASRRTIFPTGGCDESNCEIPINKKR